MKKHETLARAQEIDGEFVVFKCSTARLAWEGAPGSYQGQFNELVENGTIALSSDGLHREFVHDYAFSSPSAAAVIIAGRSANARPHWADEESGLTYAQWQEAWVDQAVAQTTRSENAPGNE